MLLPEQSRMARAALNWTFNDLARAAKLSGNTVLSFEKGIRVRDRSVVQIQQALERAGCVFEGNSVKVVKPQPVVSQE